MPRYPADRLAENLNVTAFVWWDRLANWHIAEQQYGAALGHGEPWRFPAPVRALVQ
ncbi:MULTISPECIES: hypothetical protein [Sphingomonadaceae]|uniref:hypothetical protein n=1 Tax=Sphingomonadales TaxID=204457 RepID=UPI0007703624|nr:MULTISPECIES: hypothetical protein [Sphingomonadaceae]AMK23051.1 superoxide dismutase [Sphingobium sp. TKS]MCF8707836.1 hypothetical protein [Rhizorhapis sp. SPR117]